MSDDPLSRMLMVGLLGLSAIGADAAGQCNYDVTILQYPINCGIGNVLTRGRGMNRYGTVVGYYYCPASQTDEAFLWTPEDGFITLQRPPGVISAAAVDINDQGVICGDVICVDTSGDRGFVWSDGQWTILPPVLPEAGSSFGRAISESGVVMGDRSTGEDVAPRTAYTWSAEGGFVDLGVMNGPISSVVDMTESGTLVGWTGNGGSISDTFIWQDKQLTFLGPIPGGFTSRAFAVSEGGLIAGFGLTPMEGFPIGVARAFIWKNGVFTLIGTLPNHVYGAFDVSDRGQAVGETWASGNNVHHGFLWQNGVITELNTLIPPTPNVNINSASRVLDDGTILAEIETNSGTSVAILTPIGVREGDLDLDCRVGIIDFLMLLAHWGPCPETPDCPADINDDGTVGLPDFAILLDNWG